MLEGYLAHKLLTISQFYKAVIQAVTSQNPVVLLCSSELVTVANVSAASPRLKRCEMRHTVFTRRLFSP